MHRHEERKRFANSSSRVEKNFEDTMKGIQRSQDQTNSFLEQLICIKGQTTREKNLSRVPTSDPRSKEEEMVALH